jgi:hypothetical protein
MNFKMSSSGLCVYRAPDLGLSLVQTINNNSKFLTPRQIEAAKCGKDLYEMIVKSSYADFIAIIQHNLLPNINISFKDIENAQRIHGKDLGSIQGKTVRWCPDAVTTNYIEVPPEIMTFHQGITIAVDVNGERTDSIITHHSTIQKATTQSYHPYREFFDYVDKCFAPKGIISNTLSHQDIVTGLSPNTEKHCRIPFGGYAQVYVDSLQENSVMRSRTVGAISLGPTGNIQGTYKFMSLLTGRFIKACLFTPLPIPEEVIMQLERMGTFNSAFKFDETDNEYLKTNNDDVSLESSGYSDISQSESADILNNNQIQV